MVLSTSPRPGEVGPPPPASILVASLTTYFLEKGSLWFEKNREKMYQLSKTQRWWQENCLFLEKNKSISPALLAQKLIDFGYEKTQAVTFPGEFSQRSSLLEIFPINSFLAYRLEFFGNQIENITGIDPTRISQERSREILAAKLKAQKLFSGVVNLQPGDYVVHSDHGVAKFVGISYLVSSSWYRENEIPDTKYKIQDTKYYTLEYAQGDKLYVPLGLERKLSRYVGLTEPKINRLGGSTWEKTKQKVKEEVAKFARELLQIYAQRETALRPAYSADPEMGRILNDSFPYQETPDQLKTLSEIERDLSRTKPMDRLVCGDVGFGKTEIALRTIVNVVSDGRQAFFLCPTTILAHQHFQNFKERLGSLPLRLALLTRLQNEKEQKQIIQSFGEGKIDVILGTHRLLSKDLQSNINQLGLLVIDDEQKFGVRQKERLKELRASLDVLSLSATPIPRTLYLALSSLREMSFIQTPPPGRKEIETIISPWSEKIIRKAVRQELKRKGQIYYLHNRVSTIGRTKLSLEKLLPGVKISVVHGQLKEKEMIKIMLDFRANKSQLLLATTIIENGLDLANVNTIIVEDASRLGLAQAYQIRGRVGRFQRQAFAFFLHPSRLTPLAKERLKALKEARSLGSGWQVAMRDLEIRGAGNVLGKQQSGHVNQIGLNLYCQMLSEAVTKQKSAM